MRPRVSGYDEANREMEGRHKQKDRETTILKTTNRETEKSQKETFGLFDFSAHPAIDELSTEYRELEAGKI